MGDVVGHDPARWPRPRRSIVIAAVALVLAGVTWLAVANRKPHSAGSPFGSPASAATSPGVPTVSSSPPTRASGLPGPVEASTFVAILSPPAPPPPTLTGPAPAGTGVRLLVISNTANTAAAELGIFALDGGAIPPVHGIAAGGCPVGGTFRIPDTEKWAVVWQTTDNASAPCAPADPQLYIIDAITATARLVGAAENVVPAERGSLWTITGVDLPPSEQLAAPQHVQRISPTGGVLSRAYALPAAWGAVKGLAPDLLLLARHQQADGDNWETWQPSTGTVRGQYERVLAANGNVVVWVNNTCVPDNCPVHLSAAGGGTDRTVSLPAGAYAYAGSLSDDGTHLALSLGTGVDTEGATNQDTGVLVDLSTGAVHPIQQTTIPAGETGSLSLNWAPHGWLIINTPGPNQTSQLAGYNPATGSFVVSANVPPVNEFIAF